MALGGASENAGRSRRSSDDWLGVGGERCRLAGALAADGAVLFVRFRDANRRELHQRLFRFSERCRRRTAIGSETRLCAGLGVGAGDAVGNRNHDFFGLHRRPSADFLRRLGNAGGRRGLRAVLLPLHDPSFLRRNGRFARLAVFRHRACHNDLLFGFAVGNANRNNRMFAAVGGLRIGGRYAVGGEQCSRHRQRPTHGKTNPHRGDWPTTRASFLFPFGLRSRYFRLFSVLSRTSLGNLAADYFLSAVSRDFYRENVGNRAGRSVESDSRTDRPQHHHLWSGGVDWFAAAKSLIFLDGGGGEIKSQNY